MIAAGDRQADFQGWDIEPIRSALESVLLVLDEPATPAELAEAVDTSVADVRACLRAIQAEFDARGSGFDLREVEGRWRLYTRREHAQAVEEFLLGGSHTRLSQPALETLAVVAYRQPVTRAQIAAIRGVNVDGVMRTLALRGLVEELEPDAQTGAHRYKTTSLFLEQLGISSLKELPDLAPLLPEVDTVEEPETGAW